MIKRGKVPDEKNYMYYSKREYLLTAIAGNVERTRGTKLVSKRHILLRYVIGLWHQLFISVWTTDILFWTSTLVSLCILKHTITDICKLSSYIMVINLCAWSISFIGCVEIREGKQIRMVHISVEIFWAVMNWGGSSYLFYGPGSAFPLNNTEHSNMESIGPGLVWPVI